MTISLARAVHMDMPKAISPHNNFMVAQSFSAQGLFQLCGGRCGHFAGRYWSRSLYYSMLEPGG